MASGDEACNGSKKGSSCNLLVIPSSDLNSSLQSIEAEIIRERHLEQEQASSSDGNYDDDLMTPPDVLLKEAMKQAKHLISSTQEMGAVTNSENDGRIDDIIDCCIRCMALARIVHGESHWVLAKMHVQLAKAYLDFRELHQQALLYATKGREILLAPGGQVASGDSSFEVMCQLAMAHCLVGCVNTMQEHLPKAEQEITRAKKLLSQAKHLPDAVITKAGVELEIDLFTALAKLNLKQEKYDDSRNNFAKSVGLTKSAFGHNTLRLLPLLRGKATAEAHLLLQESTTETLQEARNIAETNLGGDSEVMAELIQAEGRLGAALLRRGLTQDWKTVEDKFLKAYSIFESSNSEKSFLCKEELCLMMVSLPECQERAVPLLKELLRSKREKYGHLNTEVGHILRILGTVLLALKKINSARIYLQEARDVYVHSLGANHKMTSMVTQSLQAISGSTDRNEGHGKPVFKTVV